MGPTHIKVRCDTLFLELWVWEENGSDWITTWKAHNTQEQSFERGNRLEMEKYKSGEQVVEYKEQLSQVGDKPIKKTEGNDAFHLDMGAAGMQFSLS